MTPGDWIEWKGGECPVGRDDLVEYQRRDGIKAIPRKGRVLDWEHIGQAGDIIAYRVVSK